MNAEKIKELRGLVAAATQGPWAIYPEQTGCEIFGGDSATLMHFCRPPRELAANSAAIVALFNAAPALLDEVEALRAALIPAARILAGNGDLREVLMNVQNNINSPACAGMANGVLRAMDRLPDLRAALAARREPKYAEHD